MSTKNAANRKGLKFIPTARIKEILDSPNNTGIDGRDYGPVIQELEQIYFERIAFTCEKRWAALERARFDMFEESDDCPPPIPYEAMIA